VAQLLDSSDQIAYSFSPIFGVLRAQVVQQLLGAWDGLEDYRDSSSRLFLDQAVPLVQAARETAASTQAAMIGAQLTALGQPPDWVVPIAEIASDKTLRNGTPIDEVYLRPFTELWRLLGEGQNFDSAVEKGAQRVRQLIETDLQLSRTHTSKNFFSHEPRVLGFRRVPTGVYTCALCLVASTQRYRSFDLLPIHPGCDCSVAPIVGTGKSEHVVDRDFLDQIHEAIQKTFGMSARDAREVDYRKIMVVHEHGEIGPMLAKRGNHFTTV